MAEHPSIEDIFIQEAVKHLTAKQRAIWEYDRLDHMTQDEIALKVNISQPMVSKHLLAIEKRMYKWMKANKELFKTLKRELPIQEDNEIQIDERLDTLRDLNSRIGPRLRDADGGEGREWIE